MTLDNFLLRISLVICSLIVTGHTLSSCQPSGQFPEPLAVVPSENQRYLVVSLPIHLSNYWHLDKCGLLSDKSLLMLEALIYARDTVTRRHNVVDYPLGLMALDNCNDGKKAERDVENFESCSLSFVSTNGVINPDFAAVYMKAGDPDKFSNLDYKLDNVYKKPHMTLSMAAEIQVNLLQSLVRLTKHLQLFYTATIVSYEFQKGEILPLFDNISFQNGLCNEYFNLTTSQPNAELYHSLLQKINQNKDHKVILLLTNGQDTAKLFGAAMALNISLNFRWIGFTSSLTHLDDRSTIPPGCIMLAREVDLEPFYNYLDIKRRGELMLLRNPWMEEYLGSRCNSTKLTDCQNMFVRLQENQWLQYNDFISEVIIRYDAAAVAWAELQKAHNVNANSEGKLTQIRMEAIKERLQTLSTKYIMILNYQQMSRDWHFVRVGTLTNGAVTELQGIWSYTDRALDQSACSRNCNHCPPHLIFSSDKPSMSATSSAASKYYLIHKNDIWACTLSGLTGLLLCITVSYEVYALTKICVNLSHGSAASQSGIFLGQVLLFSIFLMTLSVYTFTFESNYQMCAVKRFLPSAASVLCFGALFVKVLVLISVKKGQFLSAWYQGLMLTLIVVIQTVVNVQWLLNSPVNLGFDGRRWRCLTPFDETLKILVFPVCLIGMCCVSAFVTRKNPYNYRENVYVGIVSGLCGLIWAVWITVGKLVDHPEIENISMGFGMFTTSALLLFVMFFPRSRQRTAMGEGLGLHPEDIVSIKTSVFNPSTNLWVTNSNSISPSISDDSPTEQSRRIKQDDSLLIPTNRLKTTTAPSVSIKNVVVPVPNMDFTTMANDPGGSVATLDVPPMYNTAQVKNMASKQNGALKRSNYMDAQQLCNKVVTFNHKPLMIEPIEEIDPGLPVAQSHSAPTPAARATLSKGTLRRLQECPPDYGLSDSKKTRNYPESHQDSVALRFSERLLRATAFAYRSHSFPELGKSRRRSNLHKNYLMYQSRSISDITQDETVGIRP